MSVASPRSAPAARAAAVRDRLTGTGAGADAPTLDAFLAESDPLRAVALWTGEPPGVPNAARLRALVQIDVARIDALLSAQVDAILHHPRFQALEASWRGLAYLVWQVEGYRDGEGSQTILRVLDVTWADLARDLERAIDFDQSQLFKKVYDAEFGSAGGQPYGAILADFEFSHRPRPGHPSGDLAVLEALARICSAAFAPLVAACHPSLLGLDTFGDIESVLNLTSTFELAEYTKWTAFRRTEDARFASLALPRVLARLPWYDDGSRADGFRYREDVSAEDGSGYLWGTAVYAFGAVLGRAIGETSWPADIRGIPQQGLGGGLVTGLPVRDPGPDTGPIERSFSTDVLVTDRLERELGELGFMPLCPVRGTPWSVFFTTPSVQVPRKYDKAAATTNAKLSSMLQYMLCVARFAHFIKVIGRDKIGSFQTAEQCQRHLYDWLMKFTTGDDHAQPAVKARFPLREAKVEVRAHPARPGAYACVVHLRPHYQLDQVAAAVRLVTEFAPVRAG